MTLQREKEQEEQVFQDILKANKMRKEVFEIANDMKSYWGGYIPEARKTEELIQTFLKLSNMLIELDEHIRTTETLPTQWTAY